jgi:hypothetical protein
VLKEQRYIINHKIGLGFSMGGVDRSFKKVSNIDCINGEYYVRSSKQQR